MLFYFVSIALGSLQFGRVRLAFYVKSQIILLFFLLRREENGDLSAAPLLADKPYRSLVISHRVLDYG